MRAALVLLLVVAGCASVREERLWPSGPLTAVPFDQVEIADAFWKPKIEVNRLVTVAACLDKCEETGRIANFTRCAKVEPGEHHGALYNDSDVYKVLEGAAYTLKTTPDAALEARVDALIDLIAAAQQPDGYLNTYWTMVKPAERWSNIAHGHEMYCAGHLIEAAIAYRQATGKRKLLDVAIRLADHIGREFGPDKRLDPCGHPEIELALVKLWRETDEPRYLEIARFFVDQRGSFEGRKGFGEYAQDHRPVREQREIVGHAVRAMYLYCAMADIAGVSGERGLWGALDALWSDVVGKKMYVTGGIGSSATNEGFTTAFDLPNDTAYCETCAAIGMALWNQRMFLATGHAKYADIVERELYNGFLSGVSASGDRFFYDNPLASRGGNQRVPWFDCSCCPTNIVRFLPAIGERIYAQRGDELYVSLFVASATTVELAGGRVRVAQETRYPWDGDVVLRVDPVQPFHFDLRLRVPDWCEGRAEVTLGGVALDPGATARIDGFLSIRREWHAGDLLVLRLPMEPRRVYADPRVKADAGRVALMRGPLVYCVEALDNGGRARDLFLSKDAALHAGVDGASSGPGVRVFANAARVTGRNPGELEIERDVALVAVPYYSWANRGPGEMAVWLPESAELAEIPGEGDVALQDGARISASHCWRGDTLLALNDGLHPAASNDQDIPRHTFWDHRGTLEWLQYEFPAPRWIDRARVYWFDDTGRGSCRAPKSWRLLRRDGENWTPVSRIAGAHFGCGKDAWQEVAFEPVLTDGIRLEVELLPEFSAGVLEWVVEGTRGR